MISYTINSEQKKILDDALKEIEDSPPEIHLPQEILELDKVTLLRLISKII